MRRPTLTELALRPAGNGVATYTSTSAAVASLADWAQELDAAYAMATKLCRTSFAPKHFQGKPEEAAAAILTGHELGLSPMASLRAIFNIGGTPGMYAKVMVAVAQSRGHIVHVAEQSDERVVVRGRRKGETEWVETVWDRARVVKAKLTNNAKYQESPQQMMVARGQAEIARQVAADALHGIPYSVEELEDMPPAVRVEATVAPRVTREEILGQAEPNEAEQAQPATPEQPPAEPRRTSTPQQRKMHALLRDKGKGDRDVGLVYIAGVIDRPIESTKELSVSEERQVIKALEELADEAYVEPDLLGEDGAE